MKRHFINSRSSSSEQKFFAEFFALEPMPYLNMDADSQESRTTSNILNLANETIAYPAEGSVFNGCFEFDTIELDYTGYAKERDPMRLALRGIVELGMNPRLIFRVLSGKIVIIDGRNPVVTYVYLMGRSKQLIKPFVLSLGRIYIVELPPQSEWAKVGLDFFLCDSSFVMFEEFRVLECLQGIQARRRQSSVYVFDDLY